MSDQLRALFITSLSLTTALVAMGFIQYRFWVGLALALALGILWFEAKRRRWQWSYSTLLLIFVSGAIVGTLLGNHVAWMFFACLTVLITWDLSYFDDYLAQTSNIPERTALVRTHLWRLAIVSGVAIILGAISLVVRFKPNISLALILSLILVVAVNRAIITVRQDDSS